MQAGIRDILIITYPRDTHAFQKLLQDGRNWGVSIQYAEQVNPRGGIAEAFSIGKDFIDDDQCALILGDNIIVGEKLHVMLHQAIRNHSGATVFTKRVSDPERFGIVNMNSEGKAVSIIEKPSSPTSNLAVTGIYLYDNSVVDYASRLTPSHRGELEITDLNNVYLEVGKLVIQQIDDEIFWFDVGTIDSMLEATIFIQNLERKNGKLVSSPEQQAYLNGWINREQLLRCAETIGIKEYSNRLQTLAEVD